MAQQEELLPPVGKRYRLKRLVDRLPDFEAQAGMTGTIKTSTPDLIALQGIHLMMYPLKGGKNGGTVFTGIQIMFLEKQ